MIWLFISINYKVSFQLDSIARQKMRGTRYNTQKDVVVSVSKQKNFADHKRRINAIMQQSSHGKVARLLSTTKNASSREFLHQNQLVSAESLGENRLSGFNGTMSSGFSNIRMSSQQMAAGSYVESVKSTRNLVQVLRSQENHTDRKRSVATRGSQIVQAYSGGGSASLMIPQGSHQDSKSNLSSPPRRIGLKRFGPATQSRGQDRDELRDSFDEPITVNIKMSTLQKQQNPMMRNMLHSQPATKIDGGVNRLDLVMKAQHSTNNNQVLSNSHLEIARIHGSANRGQTNNILMQSHHSLHSSEPNSILYNDTDSDQQRKREIRKQSLKAMQHAQTKNPATKEQFQKIREENHKLLKSMFDIEKGKGLQVASHRLRSEDCQIKSLNFDRAKQIAQTTDKNNQHLLRSIQGVKTGVPSQQKLRSDWSRTQKYRHNLKQQDRTQHDVRKLLHRRVMKLASDSSRVNSPHGITPLSNSGSGNSGLPRIPPKTSQRLSRNFEKSIPQMINQLSTDNSQLLKSPSKIQSDYNAPQTQSQMMQVCDQQELERALCTEPQSKERPLVVSQPNLPMTDRKQFERVEIRSRMNIDSEQDLSKEYSLSDRKRTMQPVLQQRVMKIKSRVYGLGNRQNSDLKEVTNQGSSSQSERKTGKIDNIPNLYLLKKRAIQAKKNTMLQLSSDRSKILMKSPSKKLRESQESLDIEVNKGGFYGRMNRPVLRNVFDSKHEKLVQLSREKKAFQKTTKANGNIFVDHQDGGQNIRLSQEGNMGLITLSDRSQYMNAASPNSQDQAFKAWTTQQSSEVVSAVGSDSEKHFLDQEFNQVNIKKKKQIKKPQVYKDNGRLYNCRNQIIGVQEIDKLKKLKRRLNTVRQPDPKFSIPKIPNKVLSVNQDNQNSKKSVDTVDLSEQAFKFNPVEVAESPPREVLADRYRHIEEQVSTEKEDSEIKPLRRKISEADIFMEESPLKEQQLPSFPQSARELYPTEEDNYVVPFQTKEPEVVNDAHIALLKKASTQEYDQDEFDESQDND